MKCPRCQRPVDHEAASCYSCGYSEADSATLFGKNQVVLPRVHDAAGCLRKRDRDNLAETLNLLELKFPQILFCAYLGTIPARFALSEFGFWLLNHGQVKGAQYVRPNENGVLVIMDLNRKQIGISLGYFVEMLLSEEDTYGALVAARPNLLNSEYGEAIEQIFVKLGKALERQGKKLRKLTQEQLQQYREGNVKPLLDIPSDHGFPRLLPPPDDSSRFEALLSA